MKAFLNKLAGNQEGLTLLEALVSLAVLGFIAVAILSGLASGAKATIIANEQATAESLARSEIEYVKGYPYQYLTATYPADPSLAAYELQGWHVPPPSVALVHDADDGLQKIIVNVERYGKTILSIIAYKADR